MSNRLEELEKILIEREGNETYNIQKAEEFAERGIFGAVVDDYINMAKKNGFNNLELENKIIETYVNNHKIHLVKSITDFLKASKDNFLNEDLREDYFNSASIRIGYLHNHLIKYNCDYSGNISDLEKEFNI